MNSGASMLPRKSVIVLVMTSLVLTCLLLRQQGLTQSGRVLSDAQRQNGELQKLIANVTASRDSLGQELRNERRAIEEKQTALVKAEQELARVDPDARWANPPANGPEWDDRSPYVWVNKKTFPMLPGSPFTDNAELRDETAATLALDPSTAKALNGKLAGLVAQYRALEAAHAERVDEPLPGIGNDGPQVTVRVTPFPEEGARLKEQFEETLREALGPSRAELILAGAMGWLDSQFDVSGSEPKILSVVRHPDGTYNLSIRTGNSWFSTGGFKRLGDHVPDSLLPLFADVLEYSEQEQ